MISEPITLYKLMVLYMLKRVNFPLSNGQMSEFFVGNSYTNYFTFQQVINELLDSKLVHVETIRNTSIYEMTKEGEEVLFYFGNKLSEAVTEDIDQYLKANRYKLRSETSMIADYYKSTNNDYIVHCEVREGKITLINLEVSVATKEMAERMCDNWKSNSQSVYSYIMNTLI